LAVATLACATLAVTAGLNLAGVLACALEWCGAGRPKRANARTTKDPSNKNLCICLFLLDWMVRVSIEATTRLPGRRAPIMGSAPHIGARAPPS
jgi:hypothetical protein